jgi:hypothetical protein
LPAGLAVATLLNRLSGEAIRGLLADALRYLDLMKVIRIRVIVPSVSLPSTCCGEAPLIRQ